MNQRNEPVYIIHPDQQNEGLARERHDPRYRDYPQREYIRDYDREPPRDHIRESDRNHLREPAREHMREVSRYDGGKYYPARNEEIYRK